MENQTIQMPRIGDEAPEFKAVTTQGNIIRTIIYYPLSLGRNFDEIKRVLIGLQTADNFAVALPADWRPDDDVIVPTAGSCGVAKSRMDGEVDGVTCHDWFFCTKKLSKEEVESKLGK
jgi:peroxiredoxin (alkyl hydroperoxide reductase subunit C)